MTRWPFLLLVVLAACSGGSEPPPSSITNACTIKKERPSWYRAMEKTERKWGVPVELQMATFYQESSFRAKARTPRKYFLGFIPNGRVSSAYGYAQAIDGTWDWYQSDTGRYRAKRHKFHDASDFMGWYMAKTTEELGVLPQDAYNHYLAYHEGHAGFARQSYRSKAWLQNTAAKVDARMERYQAQLAVCS